MITIEYCKEGHVISDFEIEMYQRFIKGCPLNFEVKVASAIAVDAARVLILRGEIKHTEIQFKFKDQILSVNKYGRIDN